MQHDPLSFWTFSLSVYDNSAVQRECLDLQDRYAIDVNLLLFCAYAGAVHGAVLSPADLRQAGDVVHDWHAHVVNNLRTARRALKSLSRDPSQVGFDSFYDSLKERELEAERLEQTMLEHWSAPHWQAWPKAAASVAVENNIMTLFEVCLEGVRDLVPPKALVSNALQYAARV